MSVTELVLNVSNVNLLFLLVMAKSQTLKELLFSNSEVITVEEGCY
jgi:hypothetical protein